MQKQAHRRLLEDLDLTNGDGQPKEVENRHAEILKLPWDGHKVREQNRHAENLKLPWDGRKVREPRGHVAAPKVNTPEGRGGKTMKCQMCNEWEQEYSIGYLHKKHEYEINEDQGNDHQVEDNPAEVTDDSIRTRAIHNHDVYDHELMYHAVTKDDVGTSEGVIEDEDNYPWFSARVICHWLVERIKHDNTL